MRFGLSDSCEVVAVADNAKTPNRNAPKRRIETRQNAERLTEHDLFWYNLLCYGKLSKTSRGHNFGGET
jgi:hypothetical protein